MKEREHVISLLQMAKQAAKNEDVGELNKLSDMTIHSASIYHDEDNIFVAVIIYSLAKVVSKGRKYYKENYDSYFRYYLNTIDRLIACLRKNDEKEFKKLAVSILEAKETSGDLKIVMQSVFRKARINKAAKIYEHGLSMGKTAELTGISLWELAEFAGQTNISEIKEGQTMPVKQRIKILEEIFK